MMAFTHGGRKIGFKWLIENEQVNVQTETGLSHAFAIDEILSIVDWLAERFGNGWFPLANNVEKLGTNTEQPGLGLAILSHTPKDIFHAQGASYLGVILEHAGILDWNGKSRGISWKLLQQPRRVDELNNMLANATSDISQPRQLYSKKKSVEKSAPLQSNDPRRNFLRSEFCLLSMGAALSTRDKSYPIYCRNVDSSRREPAKAALRKIVLSLDSRYSTSSVTDEQHVAFISYVAAHLSSTHEHFWHKGRFRYGIAQKLINLQLKYLWVSGFIPEPPHCPVDGIIRDLTSLEYDWTRNDSATDYTKAIKAIRCIASTAGLSLSEWELRSFNRRNSAT